MKPPIEYRPQRHNRSNRQIGRQLAEVAQKGVADRMEAAIVELERRRKLKSAQMRRYRAKKKETDAT